MTQTTSESILAETTEVGATSGDSFTILLATDRSRAVDAIRQALGDAGIPFRSGLLAVHPPKVVFSVPVQHLEVARRLVEPWSSPDREDDDEDDEATTYDVTLSPAAQTFPWGPVLAAGAVIGLHVALVLGGLSSGDPRWLMRGALVPALLEPEPWRLLTSTALHVDLEHVGWNGLSMVAFAVPVVIFVGYVRAALIYLAAGVVGGMVAAAFAEPGAAIVGSSGAVAGLFGAWVALTWRISRRSPFSGRARMRTLGVALLMLPSLVTPVTSSGHSVSVSSHLGGLATGMLIGAILSLGMLLRPSTHAIGPA